MNAMIYRAQPSQIDRLIRKHLEGKLTEMEIQTLVSSSEFSDPVLVGMYEDKLVCLAGLVPLTLLSNTAHIWLYATEELSKHKIKFGRHSRRVINDLLNLYPTLIGQCYTPSAVSWLDWLGAEFTSPLGLAFPFTLRKSS